MSTILIYEAAADIKTGSDPDDVALAATVAAAEGRAQTQPTESARRMRLRDLLIAEVAEMRTERVGATAAAVGVDNAGAGGSARGTTGDDRPSDGDIGRAARSQQAQIDEFLSTMTEAGLESREEQGRPDRPDAEPGVITAFSVSQQVAHRYRGSEADTWGSYRTEIPLGAQGGRGTRGVATLTFTDDRWSLALGGASTLRPELRNDAYDSGPIDDGAVRAIGAAVERVRGGAADAETPTPAGRGFPDAYKQRSVELYRELREGAASDAAAIRAVLDELEEPVGRDKPHPSTIRRWVAGDLTAEDPE